MHDILRSLPPGARILDLGARSGSFDPSLCAQALVVRLDLDRPAVIAAVPTVQADAVRLPFRDHAFDVVISNHSLEHMTDLDAVLAEIARVVRPSGALYIAVPDSTTISDRLYRWVYHGGGHVNPFESTGDLDRIIRRHVTLPLAGTRVLHTSFAFLERRHFRPRPPRRLWLFLNGHYNAILTLGYLTRILDRILGTRFSVYGWALYYGRIEGGVETQAWTNVCAWCGSAQPAGELQTTAVIGPLRSYRCPSCGAPNLYTADY